jgi:predicted  nucleic acid-binding Zn-ribbon protein
MVWDDLDLELEQWQRDFDRRVEEGRREIRERIEGVEQRCKEAEETRQREWEDLKGRVMTAQEKQEHRSDAFLRLMAAMTDEYVTIARSIGEDMKREFAESRAESRAQSEALMRMFDRLSPLQND